MAQQFWHTSTLHDITNIAECVIAESTNRNGVKALNKILEFDPYVNLCSLTLQAIFDEGRQNDEVTEELIRNYSHDYSGDAKTFREIFSNGYDTTVTVDLKA